MGQLCSAPDPSLGGRLDNSKEEVVIWGDYFSPQTRTTIGVLEHCGIKYRIEAIDTKLGEISEEELYHKITLPPADG